MAKPAKTQSLSSEAHTMPNKKYIATGNDTLWGIAKKELGSSARYTEIVKMNKLKSSVLTDGQKLRIPRK